MNSMLIRVVVVMLLSSGLSCAQPIPPEPPKPEIPVDRGAYAWLEGFPDPTPMIRLDEHFEAPHGGQRITADEGSFSAWLRGLPIRLDRKKVLSYSGRTIAAPAEAIVVLDVGSKDLQQCADTVLRLHAEYLWSAGRADEAGYHFTSGDLSTYAQWVEGERFVPRGARVERRAGSPRAKDHTSYRNWLEQLFIYAGTLSLDHDSDTVSGDFQPGDFFVDPGSPGHAIIILDVAITKDGKPVALVGQGFTPAQELHVVHSPEAIDSLWFRLPQNAEDVLDTPSWSAFTRGSARRFKPRD